MKPLIINAKALKEQQIEGMKQEVNNIKSKIGRVPKLLIVKASDDKASENYIRNKIKLGSEIGIEVEVSEFDETVTQEDLKIYLDEMSSLFETTTDGIILQLPIYNHLDEKELLDCVSYDKDADCFNSRRIGEMMQGKGNIRPCTPQGVLDILDYHNVNVTGKRVTVVGRGLNVGLSLSVMLTQGGAIVTTTHSKTDSLENDIRNADIVVSCVGRDKLIQPEWMKSKSILIGVGIVFRDDRKQYTDYDIEDMLEYSKCDMISDRVNSSGTTTVLNLMRNTIELCKEIHEI